MRWLKKSTSEPLAVAMSGVKLGDRVLVAGCSDPALIAALAIKSGLTGRACAVDPSSDRVAHAAGAVERLGALVETSVASLASLPFDEASFDLVVLRDVLAQTPEHERQAAAAGALRVLRPGGRCVVIDTATRGLGGLFGGRASAPSYLEAGGAPQLLESVGFVAARTLAVREGLAFVEGVKRNVPEATSRR